MSPKPGEIDIERLLQLLTVEEKVGLLAGADWWRTVIIERDGISIPHIKISDGPNGARGESYVSGVKSVCFPSESNLGSTFDIELVYRIGQELAEEAKRKSADVLLAPTVNVVRSPLGGRNHETYGEDPFLLGKLGGACVRGLQSRRVGGTPKHFVANEAENKRRTLNVQVSETVLREIYLYPFQLILREADPWCFMTSYNAVQGEFAGASKRLVTEILRNEWGFKGLVMSDWAGTYSTIEPVNAGMDLEMPGPTNHRGKELIRAVKSGEVEEATVDASSRRILRLIGRAGKFDDPNEAPEKHGADEDRQEIICQAAAEGFVLLKNDGPVLPLPQKSRLAVIGHHATKPPICGGGSARVFTSKVSTPLEALQAAGYPCSHAPGVPVFNALPLPDQGIVFPIQIQGGGSVSLDAPVRCEWFNSTSPGEEYVRTSYLKRPEYMIKEAWPRGLNEVEYCTKMQFTIIPKTTGHHNIGVTTTGEADLFINDQHVYHREQEMNLIFESYVFHKPQLTQKMTYYMVAGNRYDITLITKGTSEAALTRLRGSQLGSMALLQGTSIRFYEAYNITNLIASAANAARVSDIALIFAGKTDEFESEGYDQWSMSLPCNQVDLIFAVATANPKTIVVNFSGSPVEMPFLDTVAGVLQVWFPGQEAGRAITKVLTGQINPCGKLASSFPRRVEDSPSFGNFPVGDDGVLKYEEGRDIGYRYYDRERTPNAMFPFGFGLSYTIFEYLDFYLKGGKTTLCSASDCVVVVVYVKNTGRLVGKEIVQVYISPPMYQINEGVSGSKRPVKELKGFAKVEVQAGAVEKAEIPLDKYSVSYWDDSRNSWKAGKGSYRALVARNSVDIVGELEFRVEEEFTWSGV